MYYKILQWCEEYKITVLAWQSSSNCGSVTSHLYVVLNTKRRFCKKRATSQILIDGTTLLNVCRQHANLYYLGGFISIFTSFSHPAYLTRKQEMEVRLCWAYRMS